MTTDDGEFALVFNGEVYNFGRLRTQLQADGCAHRWRGTSDTEVLLAALVRWGVRRTLDAVDGMFAFAFWERAHRRLWLARDRTGEKPLYYGWAHHQFVFASELKSIVTGLDESLAVRSGVQAEFLQYGYIGGTRSVYADVAKLAPGHFARMELAEPGGAAEVTRYYEPPFGGDSTSEENIERARLRTSLASYSDAALIEHTDRLLRSVVRERLAADVPVGVFLSGGIDSSLVTALAQAERATPVSAFTIGFTDPRFDESGFARSIAKHLGVDFVPHVLHENEVLELVEQLPVAWDEPFADSSQIPTLAVSRLARRHVAVSLSGDGADELFCGYGRYRHGERIWKQTSRFSRASRTAAARLLAQPSAVVWDSLGRLLAGVPRAPRVHAERVAALAGMLCAPNAARFYQHLIAQWLDPAQVLIDANVVPPLPVLGENFLEQAMGVDLRTYLPDDILVKVDRAAMSVGLETRAPFLARDVVELAACVPAEARMRAGQGKWLLRQVLARYVPVSLFERPKRGFGLPVGQLLRTSLRGWGDALLEPSRLTGAGFQANVVRSLWGAHQAARVEAHERLWPILMWMQWQERWQRG
jgi:asparagine synthase (glutamine-hydrolysing)